MEMEVKITLIPKEQICEYVDMFRVTCDGFFHCGWGKTLEEAIKDFDNANRLK